MAVHIARQAMPKRIDELDGLRGIAALLVVAFHFIYRYDVVFGHPCEISRVFRIGCLGVPLFFIISGFVILMTVDRCKRPLDFVVSRLARLYPAYWVALLLTSLVVSVVGLDGSKFSPFVVVCNMSMLQGFVRSIPNVDGVYWSLAVELMFYFWMVGVFAVGALKRIEWISLAWLLGALAYWFIAHATAVRVRPLEVLFILDHCGLFVAGICLFRIHSRRQSPVTYAVLSLSLAVSLAGVYSAFETAVIAAFYFVFLTVIRFGVPVLRSKPILFFGTISYPLYLLHQNIGYVAMNQMYSLGFGIVEAIAVSFGISVALATTVCFGVEQPSRRAIRARYEAISLAWQNRANALHGDAAPTG